MKNTAYDVGSPVEYVCATVHVPAAFLSVWDCLLLENTASCLKLLE